ncbi:hypothetical protein NQ317_011663 [Molorchus minor]|uniref:C2H2-type domain-containing protein n=1 Tax=Molorchus minor TaxID=1323400 RepID=A0ABQ9JGX7_9CUCU|nr:hypothetical protein NQ317_011663 [Molorchus minor]
MEFNIVHPAVCLPCLEPLIQYFKFASTCELAEEKINKYCYQAETNVNGFLNFNKVVKFSCREDVKCAVANKILISETLFNHNSDFGETDIKIEEREIKDEIVVDLPNEIEDSENHNQLENGGITQNISSDLRWESEKHKEMNKRYSSARLKCSICNFEAKSNNSLETHLGVHEDASGVKMLRCCKCDFKTKNKKISRHTV